MIVLVTLRNWSFILLAIALIVSCNGSSIQDISFTECDECPILNNNDTIAFIDEVRNLVVEIADQGYNPNNAYDLNDLPLDSLLILFEDDQIATTCGTSNRMFSEILMLYGIESFTYNFGIENTNYTHVVALVKVSGVWTLHDAYYDYKVLNKDGELFSFFEILEHPEADFVIQSDSSASDFIINLNTLELNPEVIPISCQSFPVQNFYDEAVNGIFKSKVVNCLGCSISPCYVFTEDFINELIKNDLGKHLFDALSMRIGTSGNEEFEKEYNLYLERSASAN